MFNKIELVDYINIGDFIKGTTVFIITVIKSMLFDNIIKKINPNFNTSTRIAPKKVPGRALELPLETHLEVL